MSFEPRDFSTPKYKKWRRAVYIRDGWKCRMPGCTHGDKKRLNAHHIRMWSKYPELRFVVSNGISLCRTCHERIRGCEEQYESLFLKIVNANRSDAALRLIMLRYAKDEEE